MQHLVRCEEVQKPNCQPTETGEHGRRPRPGLSTPPGNREAGFGSEGFEAFSALWPVKGYSRKSR
ncbi:hypothetical protein EMPG_16189 [Blastomyces silverae]|uniref:Uncharacterized protein n=1 Tax=Blastomyces silverae TaxID=2060906 RepID=A0A0H1BGT6_9EURO|nr:hypothetical protein EMPG_16189 [Blastomyces silverae]